MRFIQTVVQNSEDITAECEGLSKEVKLLNCKISNMTNQFLMLSNNRFVENRVQEFQEQVEYANSKRTSEDRVTAKTKPELEAELISKMKEAIQIGIKSKEHSRSIRYPQTFLFNSI